jgi:hypothetical protein
MTMRLTIEFQCLLIARDIGQPGLLFSHAGAIEQSLTEVGSLLKCERFDQDSLFEILVGFRTRVEIFAAELVGSGRVGVNGC